MKSLIWFASHGDLNDRASKNDEDDEDEASAAAVDDIVFFPAFSCTNSQVRTSTNLVPSRQKAVKPDAFK